MADHKKHKIECHICKDKFTTMQNLIKHVSRKHMTIREYTYKYCQQDIVCQICGYPMFDYIGLSNHIKIQHNNINQKEYYDKYIKQEGEGNCLQCGKEAKFHNIGIGYWKSCSDECKGYIIRKLLDNYNLLNYGVKVRWDKEKNKKTNLEKYGVEYYSQSKEYRNKNESLGLFIPIDQLSEFQKYRRLVNIQTRKHKKELYKKWNGLDYYTGEKLMTSKEYRNNYPNRDLTENLLCPSIDHKLSVFYCFKNNISVEDCANINNLCICSRSNNSRKNNKTDLEFKFSLHTQTIEG